MNIGDTESRVNLSSRANCTRLSSSLEPFFACNRPLEQRLSRVQSLTRFFVKLKFCEVMTDNMR